MNDYRTPPGSPAHPQDAARGAAHSALEETRHDGEPGLRGLARRLVADGRVSHAAAVRAEQEAKEAEVSLLEHVIETGLVSARQATLSAAWEYGLPIMDLDGLRPETLPKADAFPYKILRKLKVLLLVKRGHCLSVAVTYPSYLALLD